MVRGSLDAMLNRPKEERYRAFMDELTRAALSKRFTQDQFSSFKMKLCRTYKLSRMPTNIEILLNAPDELYDALDYLVTKPTRSLSGVAVVAVMTKPHACPHGRCVPLTGGLGSHSGTVPQSYTGIEPATRRAIRNDYDPYLQVMNRLEQYVVTGHTPEKIELIVMGGTFMSQPRKYRDWFVGECFRAMNDFSRLFFRRGVLNINRLKRFFHLPGDLENERRAEAIRKNIRGARSTGGTLEQMQRKNEHSWIRCVSLVIETRPDYATTHYAREMLRLGCTKVEVGVQSVFDEPLRKMERGHGVEESIRATRILKDFGFKVTYHIMPGLPGSTLEQDKEMFEILFSDERFKPDMLKIYPCMVLKGTPLYEDYRTGRFKPMTTKDAITLLRSVKQNVPPYVRINRVQRDIPTKQTEAGVDMTNLRQIVLEEMAAAGEECGCIRCREVGRRANVTGTTKVHIYSYEASGGQEFFISAERGSALVGFCRLRFPGASDTKGLSEDTALIRELHVYGRAVGLGKSGDSQHTGWGKKLLSRAEKICRENGRTRVLVISGIGVRQYYRRLGYRKKGPYMMRRLS